MFCFFFFLIIKSIGLEQMCNDSFIMPKFNDSTIECEYIGDPLEPFVEDFLAICWFVNFAWLIYSGTVEIMC